MLPYSVRLDQSILSLLIEEDALVQRYRALFAQIDWSQLADPPLEPSRPGKRPHPESAYIKALLVKLNEGLPYCSQLRRFLLEHPLLVLELGFRPVLDCRRVYGFDVEGTVPSERWLREKQRALDLRHLQDLLAATVSTLQEEIAGLGEVVAFDVKHQYAWVRENNPRESIADRFSKERQPRGDPDCRVGVKRSCNQVQPDGKTKEKKEYLWGYGSGIATATTPDYGDVVLAEFTQPFNESDVSYFLPLYIQTVAHLRRFPLHISADAAYDAWYVYETVAHRGGMAAIPLNGHGHDEEPRDADGVALCPMGLRMHPSYRFQHTRGYRAQRFRCPLLFPERRPFDCPHPQFLKGKGCVHDLGIEKGSLLRVLQDRSGPLYRSVYRQRSSAERINSQAKALGIERPKVRQGESVRRLNTLSYILLNAKALARARALNASLLTFPVGSAA